MAVSHEIGGEREGSDDDRRTNPRFRREIAWGVAIPAAALGLSVATWFSDWSMGIQHQLSAHDARLSSIDRYITERRRDEDQWDSRIHENANDCNECKREIAAIQSRSSARADPFTGTEGAAMNARMDRLEQLIKSMRP